jgi:hypothetical protein
LVGNYEIEVPKITTTNTLPEYSVVANDAWVLSNNVLYTTYNVLVSSVKTEPNSETGVDGNDLWYFIDDTTIYTPYPISVPSITVSHQ